jgi:hypothetical protein
MRGDQDPTGAPASCRLPNLDDSQTVSTPFRCRPGTGRAG